VLGGSINGGRLVGEQVKVEQATLFQNRDFPVLTDYRGLFGGLFKSMYGLDNALLQKVFSAVTPIDLSIV
jgi:uncharacterized protein (DUF1501 family)